MEPRSVEVISTQDQRKVPVDEDLCTSCLGRISLSLSMPSTKSSFQDLQGSGKEIFAGPVQNLGRLKIFAIISTGSLGELHG